MMKKCKVGTTCYLENNSVDMENFSIPVILSDESAIIRYSWDEGEYSLILSHEVDAVNLERADILSIFVNHDTGELPIGRFDNVRVEDRKLKADALFDKDDDKSMMIFNKLSKGFLQSFSVGINVDSKELVKEEGDHKTYMATSWTIFECSVVGVPAIPTAKVGLRVANPDHLGETSKIQGDEMKLDFSEENFTILLANKETLDNRMSSMTLELETAQTALVSKAEEMVQLEVDHKAELQSMVGKQESFVAQTETRIKEAYAQGAQKSDTVISMINADSDEEASKILLNAEPSEPSPKGEKLAQVDPWAKIINKRKKG